MKISIINKTATLIDKEGKIHINQNLNKEQIKRLSEIILSYSSSNEEEKTQLFNETLEIVSPEYFNTKQEIQKEAEKRNWIKDFYKKVKNILFKENFELDESTNAIFYKKIRNVFLPDELVELIALEIEKGGDVTPYMKFWELCLANPNENSRAGLFKFLRKQKLIITNNGFILCYRMAKRITQKDKLTEPFHDYVKGECLRLRSQKANLKKYSLGLNNDEYVTLDHRTKKFKDYKGKILGTFFDVEQEVLQRISNQEYFTDNHTQTMKFTVGDVVSIPRSDCDENPKVECSRGLHIGSLDFVSKGGFGDAFLLCLVNPMNVVAVPYADAHKMRVCEYKVISCFDSLEEIEKVEADDVKIFEHSYIDYQLDKLRQLIENKTFNNENVNAESVLNFFEFLKNEQNNEVNLNVTEEELQSFREKIKNK